METNKKVSDEQAFKLRLSVSTKAVKSKEAGQFVTEFEIKEFDSNNIDDIKDVLTSRNYSTNCWTKISSTEDYIGMTGVTLDFDRGLTIEDAQKRFAKYKYILHTSSSHRVKEPIADRYRIILPFSPSDLRFTSQTECRKVYHRLLSENPEADSACGDPARKYFPHTPENGAELIFEVHDDGEYFNIDISDVSDEVALANSPLDYQPPDELNTKEELKRVLIFDAFIPWCIEQADKGIPEPLWYDMISILCRFEGGAELIHDISKKDPTPERYDRIETDAKIQHALESSPPVGYGKISRDGWPGMIPSSPASPAGFAKIGKKRLPDKAPDGFWIKPEDNLVVKQNMIWEAKTFKSLIDELHTANGSYDVVCPFCESMKAQVRKDQFHFSYLWCDGCQKRYEEYPVSDNLFTYKNKLLRVEKKNGKFISMEVLEEENFPNKQLFKYARKRVLNDPKRRFLDDRFQVRRIGSAEHPQLDYELDIKENSVVFKFPAIPVEEKDNQLIDDFISNTFCEHADFIKNWLALFSYTNYVTLPVIVLTGERSCGKGTFAQMVGSIFPTLFALWDGGKERFNDQFKNKLIFVDENLHAEKPTQYAEIKKITGNPILRIDEKFTPAYYVPNNINIIIATNDPRPMFLKERERPKSESTNNFFIYRLPEVDPKNINNKLGSQLKDRLGHYVRTELRERYEALKVVTDSSCRYALKTPITKLAEDLFTASKSMVELEAEDLAHYIVCGINRTDPYGNEYSRDIRFESTEYNGNYYVKLEDIRELVNRLRFKGSSNPKSYVTTLQDQGVIAFDSVRTNSKQLGYKILRDKSHYTSTVSGVAQNP